MLLGCRRQTWRSSGACFAVHCPLNHLRWPLRHPQAIEEGGGSQDSGKIFRILVPVTDAVDLAIPTVEFVKVGSFDPGAGAVSKNFICAFGRAGAAAVGRGTCPENIITPVDRPLPPRKIRIFHDEV